MSKYLSVKYLLILKKNWHLSLSRSKNQFLGLHFGRVPGGVAPNYFGRQNCVCTSTILHKNQSTVFQGLGEEERTRFGKKKKERKEKRRKNKRKKRTKKTYRGQK